MTVEGLRRKRELFGVDNPGYLTPKHKLGSLVLEEWHVKKYTFATPALRWHPKVGIALFSTLILLYFFTLKD